MSRIDPLTGQIRDAAPAAPTPSRNAGTESGGDLNVHQPPRGAGLARVILTWTVVVALLGLVVALQRPEPIDQLRADKLFVGTESDEPGPDQRIIAKLAIWGKGFGVTPSQASAPQGVDLGTSFQIMLDQSSGWEPLVPPGPLGPAVPPIEVRPMGTGAPGTSSPLAMAPSKPPAATRLRTAIIAGEVMGLEALENRLKLLEPDLDPTSELHADLKLVRAVWAIDESGAQEAVKSADLVQVEAFKERHGLFADLVLTRGDPASPLRASISSDGAIIIAILVAVGAFILLALFAGLVMWIIALIKSSQGTLTRALPAQILAEDRHAPDRILFVEMIAVFLGAFLALKFVGMGLAALKLSEDHVLIGALVGQWLVALSILWPMVRGMPARRWREFIGLTAPRGVMREVGAGFAAYFAWFLVYVIAAIVVIIIVFVIGQVTGESPIQEQPGGKLAEVLGSNNPLVVLLIVTLATMWAPLVEETIFRGTVFRLWRRRLGLIGAALGSAAIFAALHGYMPMQLVLVGLLGFGFALIREWRGSIIPCITAHCIHNSMVSILMVVLLSLA